MDINISSIYDDDMIDNTNRILKLDIHGNDEDDIIKSVSHIISEDKYLSKLDVSELIYIVNYIHHIRIKFIQKRMKTSKIEKKISDMKDILIHMFEIITNRIHLDISLLKESSIFNFLILTGLIYKWKYPKSYRVEYDDTMIFKLYEIVCELSLRSDKGSRVLLNLDNPKTDSVEIDFIRKFIEIEDINVLKDDILNYMLLTENNSANLKFIVAYLDNFLLLNNEMYKFDDGLNWNSLRYNLYDKVLSELETALDERSIFYKGIYIVDKYMLKFKYLLKGVENNDN